MIKILVVILISLISSCEEATPLSRCIKIGLNSYKSMGEYPKLKDGRDTEEEVIKSCNRNVASYDLE
jgi:hypothetical protein